MGIAGENLRPVLAINDRGLLLVQDRVGAWLLQGSTDGLIYVAEERLTWLLPLLERSRTDLAAALPHTPLADTPIPALVRFALTAWGEYWPALALGWLESGWPTQGLLDVLTEMKDSPELSQQLRLRAHRLWSDMTRP